MGPLVTTPDAELSQREIQALAEAHHVLKNPPRYGLGPYQTDKLSDARDNCVSARSRKAREHTLLALESILASIPDEPQVTLNTHDRAPVGK